MEDRQQACAISKQVNAFSKIRGGELTVIGHDWRSNHMPPFTVCMSPFLDFSHNFFLSYRDHANFGVGKPGRGGQKTCNKKSCFAGEMDQFFVEFEWI